MKKIKILFLVMLVIGMVSVFAIPVAADSTSKFVDNPDTGDIAVTVALITAGVAGIAGYKLRKSNNKNK